MTGYWVRVTLDLAGPGQSSSAVYQSPEGSIADAIATRIVRFRAAGIAFTRDGNTLSYVSKNGPVTLTYFDSNPGETR